jgi:hypothetical protein
MSQLSSALDALKANGDVAAFVATVAADLQKDFQMLSALPGIATFEQFLVSALSSYLTKIGLSPTLVELIATAIMDAL